MHGDFSRWLIDFATNDHGLLHQQGKVLLDQDINAATILAIRWQIEAARAAFGENVVAVPEDSAEAFLVSAIETYDRGTLITVGPGRVYCDGALAYLDEESAVPWRAEPAAPPPPAGTRQAVVLECWFESRSGFQEPRLMEPALGGPDTAMRAHLAMALRLIDLPAGATCHEVELSYDTGGLTVELDPPRDLGDRDCPIEDSGGYRGINHHQYRIEIALTDDEVGRFKWSRYNGGLVGRGRFSEVAGVPRLEVRANQRAIATSGLTAVYVEALAYDDDARGWYVIYGARGTIANDHEIDLVPTPITGTLPDPGPGPDPVEHFIRIWDGIELIPAGGGPTAIGDGINVTFTGGGPYPPDTFWSFSVRAGQPNPSTLLDVERSHGPGYLRAPLATFTWGPDGTVDPGTITDCRRPFHSLTRRAGCCTITVGDGVASHGDVRTIGEAIERLPSDGGTICILPGVHTGPGKLFARDNVTIHGCGRFSVITAPPSSGSEPADPCLHVSGGSNIRIENLAVLAHDRGNGILVTRDVNNQMCRGLVIEKVFASAAGPSAIDIDDAEDVLVRDCDIVMADRMVELPSGRWPALTVLGIDCRVIGNRIRVEIPPSTPPALPPMSNVPPDGIFSPNSPARDKPRFAHAGLGGMWLRGGCDHVTVLDNRIESGIGHGIILGHVVPAQNLPGLSPRFGWMHNFGDLCQPCGAGTVLIRPGFLGNNLAAVAGPPVLRVVIEGNEILYMGQSGIGVYGFFTGSSSSPDDQIPVALLRIVRNHIFLCVNRARAPMSATEIAKGGYGAIALASVYDLDLDDNRIEGNGILHTDPVCALYALAASKVRITDNVIDGNGQLAATATVAQGARGGVYIEELDDGLTVQGNLIDASLGHAIRAIGEGSVVITGNQLSSRAANNVNQLVWIDTDANNLAFADNDTELFARGALTGSHAIQLGCPSGELTFADNVCRLEADEDGYVSQIHTTAKTVRMTSNRLIEIFKGCVQFSAIVPGTGTLATVSLNQSDHCLAVQATVKVRVNNIEHGAIDPSDCPTAADAFFDAPI